MEQISATIERDLWSKLVQPRREIYGKCMQLMRECLNESNEKDCHIMELMKESGTFAEPMRQVATFMKPMEPVSEIVYFSRKQHNIHGTSMKQIVKFMAHR
jgi:hypothetical protein